MTESEWFECSTPAALLDLLNDRASKRKLRLFACACCQRIRHLFANDRLDRLLELSEQYAEGLIDRTTLLTATEPVAESWVSSRSPLAEAVWATAWAKSCTRAADAAAQAVSAARAAEATCTRGYSPTLWLEARTVQAHVYEEEQAAQCALLRDIVGNPFQPVTFLQVWREANGYELVRLAQAIYRAKRFTDMPQL